MFYLHHVPFVTLSALLDKYHIQPGAGKVRKSFWRKDRATWARLKARVRLPGIGGGCSCLSDRREEGVRLLPLSYLLLDSVG